MSNFPGLERATAEVRYVRGSGLFDSDRDRLVLKLQDCWRSWPDASPQGQEARNFVSYLRKSAFTDCSKLEEPQATYVHKIAEALLQRQESRRLERDYLRDFEALEAVVSAFCCPPITSVPLVGWSAEKGPVSCSASKVSRVGCNFGIITLPSQNRQAGLLAWPALVHEVGHLFLQSDPAIVPALQTAIKEALQEHPFLAEYWSHCAEEMAADLFGTLGVGPAFGIAFIGYFRGMRSDGALHCSGPSHETAPCYRLRLFSSPENPVIIERKRADFALTKGQGPFGSLSSGSLANLEGAIHYETDIVQEEKHPLDILRGFAIVEAIRSLIPPRGAFRDVCTSWIKKLETELAKDLKGSDSSLSFHHPTQAIVTIEKERAIETARTTAQCILTTPLAILKRKPLSSLFSWEENDEDLARNIQTLLLEKTAYLKKDYAKLHMDYRHMRHILAGAVLASVESRDVNADKILDAMKSLLADFWKSRPL